MSSSNSKPEPIIVDELVHTEPRPQNIMAHLMAETVQWFDMSPYNRTNIQNMANKINQMVEDGDYQLHNVGPRGTSTHEEVMAWGRDPLYFAIKATEHEVGGSGLVSVPMDGSGPTLDNIRAGSGAKGRGKTVGDMVGDIHGGRGAPEAPKTIMSKLLQRLMGRVEGSGQ